ncbi:MAG TPA: agmatine deiminase [Lentisphaeria bacterium]|nr:MAG: agmatine deiminase [Lentisphaerae bacterium GWF2_50_93]HCE45070.1 agmatine deiminase [Lentisphaeria bacterium]
MPTRLPAEWETQSAVLLAWPHERTNWAPYLDSTRNNFLEIIGATLKYQHVILAVADQSQEKHVRSKISSADLHIYETPCDDTWARDFGPITVMKDENPALLDFVFNGWGRKHAFEKDNLITRNLHALGAFGTSRLEQVDLVLEGGSIESDGKGTILTTSQCLLNPNRNPSLSKKQIEEKLERVLGARRFLWLNHGYLEGDDTDAHVDTLARFAPDDTILYVSCDDRRDSHYKELKLMEEEIRSFRTASGKPYRLVPLPWPAAKHDIDGNRLPATYANFLIINGAVLVPTYNDKNDVPAMDTIRTVFPDREIIGITCLQLIQQHGSLHCVTMQIPKGVRSRVG